MALERSCEDDNDCSPNLYCYITSKLCANFTVCSRYNRAEGSAPARSATQCGPCMTGYATETLADGKESQLCQKFTGTSYIDSMDQSNIIWIICAVFFIVLSASLIYFIRKRHIFRQRYNQINCFAWNNASNSDAINTHVAISNATNNNALSTATAPEEQSLFIECVEDKYRTHNNKGPTIDNEYQTSRPCVSAVWDINAAQFHVNDNNADIRNENIVAQLQDNIPDNNQPNNNQPIQLSTASVPEVNTEQQDNARNTMLQTYSSDSDANPSLETNKSNYDKKNITINQLLNQKITMNVNVM